MFSNSPVPVQQTLQEASPESLAAFSFAAGAAVALTTAAFSKDPLDTVSKAMGVVVAAVGIDVLRKEFAPLFR